MINDDESDLTDIESEDEQPLASKSATPMLPPPQPKVDKKKSKTSPRLDEPRLDEPHLYPDTVETIYNELKKGIIDVDPEYQRCVVWDDTKQGYLIDSLMNNYVVFPLVFAQRIREDGIKIKVCIDGKQRITAIQQFRDGKISYKDSQLNREMWYEKIPAGKNGKAFTPVQQQRFNNTRISICKYANIDEHDEREVFQRVQNGVALSTHERLKAVNGPNSDLVREMYRQTSIGLREYLGWEKAKGKDFFMLGQIAIIIKESIAKKPPATQITLSRVETFLNTKTAPTDKLHSSALGVIEVFNQIHENPQLTNVFENIQPQFFVMAGVMIHLYRNQYSVAQLADAVRQMKMLVKADTAAKLYKTLLTFVTKEVHSLTLVDQSLGASNRLPTTSLSKSISVPAVTRTLVPSASAAPKCTQTAQATPKRKRTTKADEDDSEYSPEACTQLTKRRKVPPLQFSDDESDDNTAVRPNPPKASVTSRRSIFVAAKASGSVSKAQTKVKSKTITTPSSTVSKSVNGTQMGRPNVKPTSSALARTKNPTTAGVVLTSTTQNRSVGSQPKKVPGAGKYMPTPPTSVLNPTTPVSPPTLSSDSASYPKPPSCHPSHLFDDELRPPATGSNNNRTGDNVYSIKTEPSHSPAISYQTPSAAPLSRLGPLLKAKQMIQDQSSSQATVDPRPRSRQLSQQSQPPTQIPTPKDHEADFQSQVDQIGSTLRSPAASTRPSANPSNSSSPSSPVQQQQPRTPAAPLSGDVTMADGTNDKGVLRRIPSPEPINNIVVVRKTDKPSSQVKFVSLASAPSIGIPSTNIDLSRFRSTSALVSTSTSTAGQLTDGNQDKPSSQPPAAATTLSEQKLSYHQMPPISKLPSQRSVMPVKTPEAQSGTRISTSKYSREYESRHYRPPPGYDPQRERSRRD